MANGLSLVGSRKLCQDISVTGKGAGLEGKRSGLWFEMWRIIRDLRPQWVIAENVGAITFRGLNAVLNSLALIGYDCEWQDIRASDVGAPHRRERIWIVSYPNEYSQSIMPVYVETPKLSKDVADTDEQHGNRNGFPAGAISQFEATSLSEEHWNSEPDILRVAYGIPRQLDRLKCLGNAIIPQIAEMLFRQIRKVDD